MARASDWLARITGRRRTEAVEPAPGAEVQLRDRLAVLARANGLTPPPVEVEPGGDGRDVSARIDRSLDEDCIVVSRALLVASAAEQTWTLATCLGWWVSPGPRRAQVRNRLLLGVIAVPYFAFGLATLTDAIDLPKIALGGAAAAVGALLSAGLATVSRRQVAALDAAGRQVLRAAGHDPGTLARLVFAGQDDPPWYRRPFHPTPPPSRRLAAAGAQDLSPARPLF